MSTIEAKLVNHLGTDLTVVNAARVSFNKHHKKLYDSDVKLIKFLAKHGHWTPFSHCVATFRIKAPLFVARQLFKHKIGLTENEVSRRYVDYEPTFYMPEVWRGKADNKKQGSSGEIKSIKEDQWGHPVSPKSIVSEVYERAITAYTDLITGGVAPEQARMVLPQAMYTEWYWTGSMSAFARISKLRISEDAQSETMEIAVMISDECRKIWPISWGALRSIS